MMNVIYQRLQAEGVVHLSAEFLGVSEVASPLVQAGHEPVQDGTESGFIRHRTSVRKTLRAGERERLGFLKGERVSSSLGSLNGWAKGWRVTRKHERDVNTRAARKKGRIQNFVETVPRVVAQPSP